MSDYEERLGGGYNNVVVRVGDTVRRPINEWTPAVHALLKHLESVGFTGSQRVLGIDEKGARDPDLCARTAALAPRQIRDARFR
jgi:hypothetical protein